VVSRQTLRGTITRAGPLEGDPLEGDPLERAWPLSSVGRIVEICAAPDGAQTSAAVMVLREAQADGDPVAWVLPRGAGLFPPDLAAAGLDLDALIVVHVPPEQPAAIPRAAELILRTGAFGAVVLDLRAGIDPEGAPAEWPRGAAWQGRLLGLAREHACRVIVLSATSDAQGSLGPWVSMRFDVRRRRIAPGRFRVEARVLKDKTGSARQTRRICAGPIGAR
jgi:recombination protein RecA